MCALRRLRKCGALGVDHEVTRDRHRVALGRKQQLKHHVRAVKEFELGGSKLEFTHPAKPFIADCRRLGPIPGEALAPVHDRITIMQPQHFHVVAPQTAALYCGERLG